MLLRPGLAAGGDNLWTLESASCQRHSDRDDNTRPRLSSGERLKSRIACDSVSVAVNAQVVSTQWSEEQPERSPGVDAVE